MLDSIKSKIILLTTAFYFPSTVYADSFAVDLPGMNDGGYDRVIRNMNTTSFISNFNDLIKLLSEALNMFILLGAVTCVGALIYTGLLFATTDNIKEQADAKKNLAVCLVCTAGLGGFRILLQIVLFLMSL